MTKINRTKFIASFLIFLSLTSFAQQGKFTLLEVDTTLFEYFDLYYLENLEGVEFKVFVDKDETNLDYLKVGNAFDACVKVVNQFKIDREFWFRYNHDGLIINSKKILEGDERFYTFDYVIKCSRIYPTIDANKIDVR